LINDCLFLGLSVTDHEEALQKALYAMHTVQKSPAGIEQRLENCEKVLHLLLQVQIAQLNSSRLEKKELHVDEVSINPPQYFHNLDKVSKLIDSFCCAECHIY